MAFLRRKTTDNISIGIVYSIFQKCIRRSLIQKALYYGKLLYNEGTHNSLRKRLVQSCLEDMCNLKLSLEIMNSKDNELEEYSPIIQ